MTFKRNRELFNNEDYRRIIKKQAQQLAELLIKTPEYMAYIEAKRRLENNDQHMMALAELRQRQMSLRLAAMLGEDIMDECDDFEMLFAAMSADPLISDYLFAEGRFSRLIDDVERVFGDKIELWGGMEDVIDYGDRSLN
ncbi:MAG: YlbF family regulator [Bacillota bacterium]|nr:YlbF family regulator [Bacillota bacterium]